VENMPETVPVAVEDGTENTTTPIQAPSSRHGSFEAVSGERCAHSYVNCSLSRRVCWQLLFPCSKSSSMLLGPHGSCQVILVQLGVLQTNTPGHCCSLAGFGAAAVAAVPWELRVWSHVVLYNPSFNSCSVGSMQQQRLLMHSV
jgi:hypothetical protein